MTTHGIIFGRILLGVALAFALPVPAQDYPSKPIKIVVPFSAGGPLDLVARLVAERLREKWPQTVVIENRTGAGGNIGAEAVFKAAPDGYTLMYTGPGPLVINKSLYTKLGYDPEAFAPVSVVVTAPNVLVVHPKVAVNSVQQLIAFAKDNPGRLNYATQGIGTAAHLTAELFQLMAGIKIVHVPYKGVAPALADLLGGQVDMMFTPLGGALPHIRAGKLRALAVSYDKRYSLLPGIPAVAEVLPGFFSASWHGMVAPPGTPPAIANKISAAIAEALKQPDVAQRLLDQSIQPTGSTPAEMTLFMRQEVERWDKVIRSSGATVE